MSAEAAAITRSWSVGPYTATLTVPKAKPGQTVAAVIEWEPRVPQRLKPAEIEQYRAGRDAAIKALGLNVLVVEV